MSENYLTQNIKTWKLLHIKISQTTVVLYPGHLRWYEANG